MLNKLKITVLVFILVAAVGSLSFLAGKYSLFKGRKAEKSLVVAILRSEDMNFLVTRKLVATVALEKFENSVWLGNRQGLLLADVEIFYGFDLKEIDESAVSFEDGLAVVAMPEPEVLTTTVNLDTMRLFTKQSGLSRIADLLKHQDLENELRQEFSAAARRYFADRGMIPDKHELLTGLNRWAAPRFRVAGLRIVFK